jgi:catechol 2,3-dioxygenase-like lactoylglutathione lyase family enzyme
MLDHITLGVSDFARSRSFYDRALAPLGLKVLMGDKTTYGGYGDSSPFFWIGRPEGEPSARAHVAFSAPDRAAVDAFHRAALAAGGRDNGGPGLRPQYHPDYYGAFVFDLDGNNIEAVCHAPG